MSTTAHQKKNYKTKQSEFTPLEEKKNQSTMIVKAKK